MRQDFFNDSTKGTELENQPDLVIFDDPVHRNIVSSARHLKLNSEMAYAFCKPVRKSDFLIVKTDNQ